MKPWRRIRTAVSIALLLWCGWAGGQLPPGGTVSGVVTDATGAFIAGAQVTLVAHAAEEAKTVTDSAGAYRFVNVAPGVFALIVSSPGMGTESTSGTVRVGEQVEVSPLELRAATSVQSVNAMTREEVAEAEIKQQEKQRVLGVVPNFFVSYNWDAQPLTAKQKFELGWHAVLDPTHFLFATIPAGIEQARDTYPGFDTGWAGYGERYGAIIGTQATSTLLRGSVMPAIFHQDPRYFYKGTGSVPARAFYAISTAVRARGDNGHWQVSSGILADFAAGAISNLYYAPSDRHGVDLTLESGAISIGGVAVAHVLQEFLFKRVTARRATAGEPVQAVTTPPVPVTPKPSP